MFSRSSKQILLKDGHILTAECMLPEGGLVHSSLDLDNCLGNSDGQFIVGNQNFFPSARNARLDGLNFIAMLKKIDGRYVHDAVNLDAFVGNDHGVLTLDVFYNESQLRLERSTGKSPDLSGEITRCSVCKDFPDLSTPDIEVAFKDLVYRRQEGNCPTCSILVDAMQNFAPEGTLTVNSVCIGRKPRHDEDLVNLEFKYDATNPISVNCVLFTPSGYSEKKTLATFKNFSDVPTAKLIIGDSSSGESLKLVLKWLGDCSDSHESCDRNDESPLPSRVLDLKGPRSNSVRLHITNHESAKYACLSHCWGRTKSLVLTNANLGKLTDRILMEELPKTYTDAIDFCRGLGIRYLWIDALCIIQRDAEDWNREAAQMSTYYSGCYVCLAVTQSFNHEGGCYVSTPQLTYSGKGNDGLPYSIAVREDIPHITQPGKYSHADYFPLLTRAWAYQERHMAPRVVHFCGFELSFECSQTTTCECERDPGALSQDFWTKAKAASAIGETALMSRWHANVTSYSKLSLTFLKDRLPALSGLAKTMGIPMELVNSRRNRYLAGLWEPNLLQDLTWCVRNISSLIGSTDSSKDDTGTPKNIPPKLQHPTFATSTRPAEYVAPTWSWASVLDPVAYLHYSHSQEYCKIISASTELVTVDPTAGVQGGNIIFKGKLAPSRWALVSHYFKGNRPGFYIARPYRPHYFSLVDIKGTRTQFGESFEDRGMMWLPDYAVTTEHVHQLKEDETLYLFPLVAANASYAKDYDIVQLDEDSLSYLFLVLRRVRAVDPVEEPLPVFERVGFASHNKKIWQTHEREEQTFKLI